MWHLTQNSYKWHYLAMVKLLLKFLNRIRIRIGTKIECLCASETLQPRQIHKKSFIYLFIYSFIHSFIRLVVDNVKVSAKFTLTLVYQSLSGCAPGYLVDGSVIVGLPL